MYFIQNKCAFLNSDSQCYRKKKFVFCVKELPWNILKHKKKKFQAHCRWSRRKVKSKRIVVQLEISVKVILMYAVCIRLWLFKLKVVADSHCIYAIESVCFQLHCWNKILKEVTPSEQCLQTKANILLIFFFFRFFFFLLFRPLCYCTHIQLEYVS